MKIPLEGYPCTSEAAENSVFTLVGRHSCEWSVLATVKLSSSLHLGS